MPAKNDLKLPDEFASTMQQLVAEAEKTIPQMPALFPAEKNVSDAAAQDAGGISERIAALEKLVTTRLDELADPDLRAQLQRIDEHMIALCKTESVNQRLFNSLHEELKSYRDNFLRESLQKPFIRDLVVLYDDLSSLSAQMEMVAGASDGRQAAITQWGSNLQNAIHSLVEILHRMEVNEIEAKEVVDRALHRVVSYEPADFAEDDGRIVMRTKRGFVWRDQVLRPEEVVAKRFE